MAHGKKVLWGLHDEERRVLLGATSEVRRLRAVVARGRPKAEEPGLLLLQATVEELDEVYTLVEELTDATRSRKRLELLDGLRLVFNGAHARCRDDLCLRAPALEALIRYARTKRVLTAKQNCAR